MMFPLTIIALAALWALGMARSHTFGGLIHALPALAVALLVYRYVQKRRSDKEQAAAHERKRQFIRRSTGARR